MYTPIKEKRSRRVMTTAYTENNASRLQLQKSNIISVPFQKQQKMANLNQKLSFQKLQESEIYIDKPKPSTRINAAKISSNFRKTMLDYLNTKFQQVYSAEEQKQLYNPPNKQQKRVYHSIEFESQKIRLVFNNYMSAIRQLRVKVMSQYFLALVLKKTNFINSILNQRNTIILLWKELNEPNIGQLFIFISVLYFHMQNNFRSTCKQNLITYAQQLFNDLGFKQNFQCLQKTFEITTKLLENRNMKLALLNNRQNRPTASSLNRNKRRI